MTTESAEQAFRLIGFLPYIWISVVVLSVIAEAGVGRRILICFLPSGVIALLLSLFSAAAWLQTAVFFAVSFVLLCIRFTVFRKKKPLFPSPGEFVLVVEGIVPERTGKVRYGGKIYIARTAGSGAPLLQPGDLAQVVCTDSPDGVLTVKTVHSVCN